MARPTISNIAANSNDRLTIRYVDPYTGELRSSTIGGDAYKYDNAFRTSRNTDVYYAIQYMLKNGNDVDSETLRSYIKGQSGNNVAKSEMKEILEDARTFFGRANIQLEDLGTFKIYNDDPQSTIQSVYNTVKEEKDHIASLTPEEQEAYKQQKQEQEEQEEQEAEEAYREAAEDYYWNQLYNLEGNTLGADMYNRLTQSEQNAAMSNMQLAEAQYQQAAMDQAAVVKSITDQVKAERMAKLKAGMNEAQIANQDMQIMLNNMNTLNQQVNTLNQNRLAAQQQYNLAQDTAYQQYLNSAAGTSQAGAAYSAAGAGDATRQSLLNMYYTDKYGNIYKKSNQNVTQGYTSNTGGNK